jgi:hypothetical protein
MPPCGLISFREIKVGCGSPRLIRSFSSLVIPAKAGIQPLFSCCSTDTDEVLDSGFRRNDEKKASEQATTTG